jgi:uncharacterized membrane protein YkvA (DUF1232 family)
MFSVGAASAAADGQSEGGQAHDEADATGGVCAGVDAAGSNAVRLVLMAWWQQWAIGLVGGLVLLWLVMLAVLARTSRGRDPITLGEALGLLPDVIRLLRRLAADRSLKRGIRIWLGLLLGYLLLPFDLVPDFIPVIGYADDAVIVALALRAVVRAAGPEALAAHWPGSPAGLTVLHRLAGLDARAPADPTASRDGHQPSS